VNSFIIVYAAECNRPSVVASATHSLHVSITERGFVGKCLRSHEYELKTNGKLSFVYGNVKQRLEYNGNYTSWLFCIHILLLHRVLPYVFRRRNIPVTNGNDLSHAMDDNICTEYVNGLKRRLKVCTVWSHYSSHTSVFSMNFWLVIWPINATGTY